MLSVVKVDRVERVVEVVRFISVEGEKWLGR